MASSPRAWAARPCRTATCGGGETWSSQAGGRGPGTAKRPPYLPRVHRLLQRLLSGFLGSLHGMQGVAVGADRVHGTLEEAVLVHTLDDAEGCTQSGAARPGWPPHPASPSSPIPQHTWSDCAPTCPGASHGPQPPPLTPACCWLGRRSGSSPEAACEPRPGWPASAHSPRGRHGPEHPSSVPAPRCPLGPSCQLTSLAWSRPCSCSKIWARVARADWTEAHSVLLSWARCCPRCWEVGGK